MKDIIHQLHLYKKDFEEISLHLMKFLTYLKNIILSSYLKVELRNQVLFQFLQNNPRENVHHLLSKTQTISLQQNYLVHQNNNLTFNILVNQFNR
jgi:hypothetical protein